MSLDPSLVLAVLQPEERAVVKRWAHLAGLDSWDQVPPLRAAVELIAVLVLAGGLEGMSATDAVRAAAEALGLEDTGESATHPADRFGRALRRWHAAARESRGQNDHARNRESA